MIHEFYTDGSCVKNGSADASGGWGVIQLLNGKLADCFADFSIHTTNNREELKAILFVMKSFGVQDNDWASVPIVYSDSAYCVNMLNEWMFAWKEKGWITSTNKQPENLDLIQEYYNLYQKGYRIELRKIRGHAGNKWNELADQIATGKISTVKIKQAIDSK